MVLLCFRGVRSSFCWQSHERVQYWWIMLPEVLWLLTIFSTREMLVETLYNGLISHNRTHTVFSLHIALIMCLECKQLFTLTKMAACHGGIQPSRKLSKHWIEQANKPEDSEKAIVWMYVTCGLRQNYFCSFHAVFPTSLLKLASISHMPVICVWKIISIISLPTYKEPKPKPNKSDFT